MMTRSGNSFLAPDAGDASRSEPDGRYPIECRVCFEPMSEWRVRVYGCRCRVVCRACFEAEGPELSRRPCVRCLRVCPGSAPDECAGGCNGWMHRLYWE